MIAFIDDHRKAYGVGRICKTLPIAPSTYHAHVASRVDPMKLSDRAWSDLGVKVAIRRVFAENFEVYGVRKVWLQLNREGIEVARCTTPSTATISAARPPSARAAAALWCEFIA